MSERSHTTSPLTIFYSYADADAELQDKLERHLSGLRREGLIIDWNRRQIQAGTVWMQSVDEHLKTASIILLLVSADFLASDYCYSTEMQRAMKRHQSWEARIIPIILRPVDWQNMPFAKFPVLPSSGKPVTTWSNLDEAFLDITTGIRNAMEDLRSLSYLQKAFSNAYSSSLTESMLEDSIRKWIQGRGVKLKAIEVGFVLLEPPKFNETISNCVVIQGDFNTKKDELLHGGG